MNEQPIERQDEIIEIHPADKELNVIVKSILSGQLREQDPKYILKIVNHVPVLVFLFKNTKDSFFKEINYPVILARADTDWIDQPAITVNILESISLAEQDRQFAKITLSSADSARLAQSCRDQVGKTAEFIESSIIHIYDNEHQDEWLHKS